MKKTFLALLLCIGMSAGGLHAADNVVIKGSTTVLPVAQVALEAYAKQHPGVSISLSGGGSGEGIKALIDGSADIATSSREIKADEIRLAQSKGIRPVAHTVAIDAIVPIVHPRNPVLNLTIDQLSQIYQGRITNWREVGGQNLKIVVISRDSSSGTFESWGQMVLGGARVTPRAQMQASNGAIVQAVSKNRYAIGYIGLGYLSGTVKALRVNGLAASVASVQAKQYPVARPLYMYTAGAPAGETKRFIDFVLSPAGQKLVAKEGFVPLPAKGGAGGKKGK